MTTLAVLMVLGIFVGIPMVVGFALAGLYIVRARARRVAVAKVATKQPVRAEALVR